ncbi:MAG: LacI family DNA-binding transcriptional regulator [Actinomycetes bacterium]
MVEAAGAKRRSVTREDVARLAGVSSAVVSYVVNNGPRPVATATRDRVLEAIDKLGYQPNAAARSLITGRAELLGLVVPDIANPYFAAMAQKVEAAAREQGLTLLLVQSSDLGLEDVMSALAGRLVVGVITATVPGTEAIRQLLRQHVPVVGISLFAPLGAFPCLVPGFYDGARTAVRHLVEQHGHTRIGMVTGSDTGEDRERGWRDVLVSAGLQPDVVVRVPWSMAGGREAAGILVNQHPDLTAVFVASDQQAAGVASGLAGRGLRIPDRLAMASFDGSPESEFVVPPLTTLRVPMEDMARDAVAMTLGVSTEARDYPTSLIIRESCGCRARGATAA